ncbi:uncharacterized protein EDB91DRAFT_1244750 [Suillus paluster]|uniref:uncharacterized protein n=1 Tax=Suillus paluster TaxID=48578 RepID=UPI001B886B90|nr:uncharacterized protein EDB91DRAFT_1244750 [Suillus paluster]KAG1748947.1 hypothetical protein EDB91DRAFT_1244750 [Suillus paluster]
MSQYSIIMVNQSTANDTASLAESTSTRSDVSSSLQPIADNVAKRVKLILPQVKATPSELHSAAPEVIDVDVDKNDAPPAAEQDNEADLNALKKTWRSAVYSFFKLDAVTVKLPSGGVRRFQDSKDKSSTTNLRHHANGCWGKEAVDRAFSGGKDNNLFIILIECTRAMKANLVRWITGNNRPVNIINDRALRDLLLSGRPNIELSSHFTISHDIRASFEKSQERIGKLLQEHAGRLHFATDAWTSPNHRSFIAWTVHLEHEGEIISLSLVDELDDYLWQPVENTKVSLQCVPGRLCTIALASITAYVFYTIATSTVVERVFSQGRHLIYFTQNRLSPSSTRAFLCLGSWPPEDLTKIMKSLKKRKREDENVG